MSTSITYPGSGLKHLFNATIAHAFSLIYTRICYNHRAAIIIFGCVRLIEMFPYVYMPIEIIISVANKTDV